MSDVEIPAQYRVRVKQRLRVLAYAKEHDLKPAARHFALSRTTVREWRDPPATSLSAPAPVASIRQSSSARH
jgi:hypothetical protein